MFIKRVLLLLLISCFFSSFSVIDAGELAFQEAAGYYNEGVIAQKGGYFDDADTAYNKALMLDQDLEYYKFIMNNIGVIQIEQEDFEAAEICFRKALEEDPDYKVARFNLGLLFYMKKDYPKALKQILKVLEINSVSLDSFTIEDKVELKEKK